MKVITIKCFNDGKSKLVNASFHFSEENKASKVRIDFSEIDQKNYQKFLDIGLSNGTYARYELGTDEIVEQELTFDVTVAGIITLSPFITDSLDEDAIKIKFQQQTVTLRSQIDAASPSVLPRNEILFKLMKLAKELEEQKLDKVVEVEEEEIDVLALLLQKANSEDIQKLFKEVTLNNETGILTFTAFDGTETSLDIDEKLANDIRTLNDNKLDKVVEVEEEEIDVLALLLQKADEDQLLDLVKEIDLNIETGIMTISKFGGAEIVYDLPLEFTVADGYYDEISHEIVIVYTSGTKIRIPVSGLITQVNTRVSNLEDDVVKIKEGTIKVKNAEYADKITTKEPKTIERIMVSDITATNDNEIVDNILDPKNAEIVSIGGVGVKQVLKNSEAEALTTKTPVNYIEGNPTTVVDGQFVVSKPKQIISKSNNLFDKSKAENVILGSSYSGAVSPSDFRFTTGFIRLKPNTTYTFNGKYVRYVYYDLNKNALGGADITSYTFTTSSNDYYYRFSIDKDDITPENLTLNQGTVALPYQPYAEHIYDLGEGVELPKLPNGVGDRWLSDGRVEVNVRKYILQASDITALLDTSIQYVRINKQVDFKYYNISGGSLVTSSAILFPNFPPSDVAQLNKLFEFSDTQMAIGVPLGTYPTLQDARNALVGTEIFYQLATPTIENVTPLPTYIDTYTQGTIIVDNGQGEKAGEITLGKLYSHNCQANTTYFVRAKLTDYTDAKVTNGTTNYPLVNGYVKFTPTVTGEYWLEYVQDGINKISKAQWIEVYDPIVKTKTADELNALYSKFHNYGLTPSNVSKLVSSGDNWYKGEYSIVIPNVEYKVIGQDFTITFYDKDKVVISTTQASTFTTPNNCVYVSSNKNDIALYLSSNSTTEYLPYTEDILEIPAFEGLSLPNGVRNTPEMTRVGSRPYQEGDVSSVNMLTDGIITWYELTNPIPNEVVWDKQYVAWNYGMEKLDGLAQIVTKYQLDLVSQTVTNTENITDNRKKITSLFEVINSQYKIELYSSTDFPQVVRKPGVLYGSYDVETKKIDWFFGD